MKQQIIVPSFMAVAHGRTATEETSAKRYIGLAAVRILGINPTAKELQAILNSSKEPKETVYVSTTNVRDSKGEDKEVAQVRLTFWVETDPAIETNNGIDAKLPITIFLSKGYQYSIKPGMPVKVKVIDKYGRTAWATAQDVKDKKIPMYKNGPAQISEGYRPCYVGEEELIGLIKALLGIPEPTEWDDENKKYVMRQNPQDAECMLDHINEYFTGNISELKEIVSYQPENRFKALFGVRTSNNGNQYQACYTQKFLKLGNNHTEKLAEEIQDAYNNNRLKNVEYEVCPLREDKVTPTNYSESSDNAEGTDNNYAGDDDPFGGVPADENPFAM